MQGQDEGGGAVGEHAEEAGEEEEADVGRGVEEGGEAEGVGEAVEESHGCADSMVNREQFDGGSAVGRQFDVVSGWFEMEKRWRRLDGREHERWESALSAARRCSLAS